MGLSQIKAKSRPRGLLVLSFLAVSLLVIDAWAAEAPHAPAEVGHGHKAAHGSKGAHGHHDTKHINWLSWDYGHGKTEANPPFLMAVINFAIVVFALVYLVRKPLGLYLADRHQRIKDDLAAAAELREQARARLDEIDSKLDGLDRQISEIRESVAKDAEAEKERIVADAEREAEAIVDSAERTLHIEVERAKRRLEVGAIQAALQSANKLLQREISAQDQQRLREEYFEQIQDSGGGH